MSSESQSQTSEEQRYELHTLTLKSSAELQKHVETSYSDLRGKGRTVTLNYLDTALESLPVIENQLPKGVFKGMKAHNTAVSDKRMRQRAWDRAEEDARAEAEQNGEDADSAEADARVAHARNDLQDPAGIIIPAMPLPLVDKVVKTEADLLEDEKFIEHLRCFLLYKAGVNLLRCERHLSDATITRLDLLEESLQAVTWEQWAEMDLASQLCFDRNPLRMGMPKRVDNEFGQTDKLAARPTFRMQGKLQVVGKPDRATETAMRRYSLWTCLRLWQAAGEEDRTLQNVTDALKDPDLAAVWTAWLVKRQAMADYADTVKRQHRIVDEFVSHLLEQRADPDEFVRDLVRDIGKLNQEKAELPTADFLEKLDQRMQTIETICSQTTYKVRAWDPTDPCSKAEYMRNKLNPALRERLRQLKRRQAQFSEGETVVEEYESYTELRRAAVIEAEAEPDKYETGKAKGFQKRGASINAFDFDPLSGSAGSKLDDDAEPSADTPPPRRRGRRIAKATRETGKETSQCTGLKREIARLQAELKTAGGDQRDHRMRGAFKFDPAAAAHNFLPKAFEYGEGLLPPDRPVAPKICVRWYNSHDERAPACGPDCNQRYDHHLTDEELAYQKQQLADQAANRTPATSMPGRKMGDFRSKAPTVNTIANADVQRRLESLEALTNKAVAALVDQQQEGKVKTKPPPVASAQKAVKRFERQQRELEIARLQAMQDESGSDIDVIYGYENINDKGIFVHCISGGMKSAMAVIRGGFAKLGIGKGESIAFSEGKPPIGRSAERGDEYTLSTPQTLLGVAGGVYKSVESPQSNPHLLLRTESDTRGKGISLKAMVDSGAHIMGAISKDMADTLRRLSPETILGAKSYRTSVPVSGIDRKSKGSGASIIGELDMRIFIEGVPHTIERIAVLEGARFGHSDLILGNLFMFKYGASLDYYNFVLSTRLPPEGGREIEAPIRYLNSSGKLTEADSKARTAIINSLRRAEPDVNTTDAWSIESTKDENGTSHLPSVTHEATEFKHAWAPKVNKALVPLCLCLAAATLMFPPGETTRARCMLRAGEHCVPACDFISNTSSLYKLDIGDDELHCTDLDGTVDLYITNNSSEGYCLDWGEQLATAWRPPEVRSLEPLDKSESLAADLNSLPPLSDNDLTTIKILANASSADATKSTASARSAVAALWGEAGRLANHPLEAPSAACFVVRAQRRRSARRARARRRCSGSVIPGEGAAASLCALPREHDARRAG